MKHSISGLRGQLAFPFVISLFLVAHHSGCSKQHQTSKHLERAEAFVASSQTDRAEIEYLNVLRIDPDNSSALSKLGEIYLDQGRFGQALPYLAQAAQLDPKNLDIRRKLSRLLLTVGARGEAMQAANEILIQKPDDLEAPLILGEAASLPALVTKARETLSGIPTGAANATSVLVALGLLEAREGHSDAAEGYFRKANAISGDFAPALAGLSLIELGRGRVPEAKAYLSRAASASEPRSRFRQQYAGLLLGLGETAEARRVLEEIAKVAPDYVPVLLRLVETAATENRLDDATQHLKHALAKDPNNPDARLMAAKIAMAQGNAELALQEAEKLTTRFPKFPQGHFEAARAHLGLYHTDAAISSLNQAIAAAPDYADAIILLASLEMRRGNRPAAVASLKDLLAKRPGLVEAQLLLAEAHRARGEHGLALAIYEGLAKNSQGNERLALLVGATLLEVKRPNDARKVFEEVLTANPKSLAALEQLTALDVANKRVDLARARVALAIAKNPDHANLYILSAELHSVEGKPEAAIPELRKSIELQPVQLIAYVRLAKLYLGTGDSAKALDNAKQAVEKNPRDLSALMLCAILYDQLKDWNAAMQAYEAVLKINPRFTAAMNNLAFLLSEQLGQQDRAFEYARRARELAPTSPEIADTLGWILFKRGDYASAARILKESAEKLPREAVAQFHLGMATYQLGDDYTARTALTQALSLDGDATWAPIAREHLAVIDPSNADPEQQERILQARLASNPKDTLALLRMAELSETKGLRQEAKQLVTRLLQLNPRHVKGLVLLARCEESDGNTAKAIAAATEARKQAPEDISVALLLANLALKTGDHAWAKGLFQEVSRRSPDEPAVWDGLGKAAFALGLVEESKSAWVQAAKLESRGTVPPDLADRVALITASLGANSPQAPEIARRRLQITPNDGPSLYWEALQSEKSNDTNLRVAQWEQLLASLPAFVPAKRHLAILLSENRENDRRTIELGMAARETYAADPELARALGTALLRQKDYRKAIPQWELVTKRFPADAEAWKNLGESQWETGSREVAKKSFEKSLELGLKDEAAMKVRGLLKVK